MAGCGGWHPLRSLDQEPALLETQGGEGCRETSRQTLIVYYACALNSDRIYVGVVQVRTNWKSVAQQSGNTYKGCFDLLDCLSCQTKVRCDYSLTV